MNLSKKSFVEKFLQSIRTKMYKKDKKFNVLLQLKVTKQQYLLF